MRVQNGLVKKTKLVKFKGGCVMLESKDSFSTLDVSEYLKLSHKELIRKVNTLISKGILAEREMRLIKPITSGGRRQLAYDLNVDEFIFTLIRLSNKPIAELGVMRFLNGEIIKASLMIDNMGGFNLGGLVHRETETPQINADFDQQLNELGMSEDDWAALE